MLSLIFALIFSSISLGQQQLEEYKFKSIPSEGMAGSQLPLYGVYQYQEYLVLMIPSDQVVLSDETKNEIMQTKTIDINGVVTVDGELSKKIIAELKIPAEEEFHIFNEYRDQKYFKFSSIKEVIVGLKMDAIHAIGLKVEKSMEEDSQKIKFYGVGYRGENRQFGPTNLRRDKHQDMQLTLETAENLKRDAKCVSEVTKYECQRTPKKNPICGANYNICSSPKQISYSIGGWQLIQLNMGIQINHPQPINNRSYATASVSGTYLQGYNRLIEIEKIQMDSPLNPHVEVTLKPIAWGYHDAFLIDWKTGGICHSYAYLDNRNWYQVDFPCFHYFEPNERPAQESLKLSYIKEPHAMTDFTGEEPLMSTLPLYPVHRESETQYVLLRVEELGIQVEDDVPQNPETHEPLKDYKGADLVGFFAKYKPNMEEVFSVKYLSDSRSLKFKLADVKNAFTLSSNLKVYAIGLEIPAVLAGKYEESLVGLAWKGKDDPFVCEIKKGPNWSEAKSPTIRTEKEIRGNIGCLNEELINICKLNKSAHAECTAPDGFYECGPAKEIQQAFGGWIYHRVNMSVKHYDFKQHEDGRPWELPLGGDILKKGERVFVLEQIERSSDYDTPGYPRWMGKILKDVDFSLIYDNSAMNDCPAFYYLDKNDKWNVKHLECKPSGC